MLVSTALLPQSPETQLPTQLKFSKALWLLRFFTQQTIEALDAFFIKGNFHEFDPHVGETSCQIRAYQLLLLALNLKNINKFEVLSKLKYLRKLLDKINNDIILYEKLDSIRRDRKESVLTLAEFFNSKNYCFFLNEDEFYLVQVKILTKYKIQDFSGGTKIDYGLLCSDLRASKDMARRLVHMYQIKLSEISCDFVLKISSQLSCPPIIQNKLSLLKKIDDDGRRVLPCFCVMKTILAHMLLIAPTILLIVERKLGNQIVDTVCLPFGSMFVSNHFLLNKSHYYKPKQVCYVIRGIVRYAHGVIESRENFVQRVLMVGFEKAILMNMAIHPQYTGKNLASASANPFSVYCIDTTVYDYTDMEQEFLFMREQAKIYGCGLDAPSLFYIEHIFLDKIESWVHLLRDKFYSHNKNNSKKQNLLLDSTTSNYNC